MIYIFDIDGTLADISHRLHFIQQKPADWRAFFAACADDKPIVDMVYLARIISRSGHVVVYVTGRSDECREATVAWLVKHDLPAPYRKVYMRKAGDHREDHIVKGELLDEVGTDFPPSHYQIIGVFEDRQQVVDMYRARGLRVFQVAPGNF